MKCVITYMQCKRAVLPYVFGKYCLPSMQEVFPGSFDLFHIFHNKNIATKQFTSGMLGDAHLDNVRTFIKENKYQNAKIIEHTAHHAELSSIPSAILAAKTALEQNADLHGPIK